MKHYVWILTERKAQNLYMIWISSVNNLSLVTHAKQTDPQYKALLYPHIDDTVIQNQEYVYCGDPHAITTSRGNSMRQSGLMMDLDEALKTAVNCARDTMVGSDAPGSGSYTPPSGS